MTLRAVLGLQALLLAAAPALAQSPRDAIFGAGSGCYLRDYSASHLADHPAQQVDIIAIGPAGADERMTIVKVGILLRDRGGDFTAMAYCENEADHLYCLMEGDAGAFTLTPAAKGAVKLSVARRGMLFEGAVGFAELSGTAGDDRVFLIPPVPADACP